MGRRWPTWGRWCSPWQRRCKRGGLIWSGSQALPWITTSLEPGLYYSRRDGDIVTFDLRLKKPNTGDLLSNSELHSVEHLIATLLRNSEDREAVIYFGPMGYQTGFYFLFDNRLLVSGGCHRAFAGGL